MRSVLALAFSMGFIAVSLLAAERNPPAPLHVVRVFEIPEGKGANPIECSPDDADCLVDMKSKLRIVPDLSALHPGGEARTFTSSVASSQREELEKALAALRISWCGERAGHLLAQRGKQRLCDLLESGARWVQFVVPFPLFEQSAVVDRDESVMLSCHKL